MNSRNPGPWRVWTGLRPAARGRISGVPGAVSAVSGVFHFAHFRCKKGIKIIFVTFLLTPSTSEMTRSASQPKYSLGDGFEGALRLRAAACGCISRAPPSPPGVLHFAYFRCKKGVEIIFVPPR